MTGLERLWAGWRAPYLDGAAASPPPGESSSCVLCRIESSNEPDEATLVVRRGPTCLAVLNAYPYTTGHVMVLPSRHVGELEALSDAERSDLWDLLNASVAAVKAAYAPQGINLGANLGPAAGAGVPGHLHLHCLPRWVGDTNFMTTVAEARVLPEALPASWARLRSSWPG